LRSPSLDLDLGALGVEARDLQARGVAQLFDDVEGDLDGCDLEDGPSRLFAGDVDALRQVPFSSHPPVRTHLT